MPLILSSATEVHVQLGNGAPVFLPTAIGQHYIDVANKRLYQSVGIAKVEDWGSPLATTADLEAFDKTVTKGEVGLGNVENYGVASKPEAEAGLLNNLYMTPLRVTELMNALFMPTLTAFMGRADNPHDVTATQVGALTVAETEALLALKMSEGDVAGLLDTFWASKIGSAPETMDTLEEIALALQNNPLAIEALQSLVGVNKISIDAALLSIGTIQTALADHQGRIEVLEASVLTHQTDLAGKATKVELAAAVETIGVEATRIDARVTTTNLEMDRVEAKVDAKVDIGGNVNTNTITVEEEEVTLVTLIAELKAAIALAGDASELQAVEAALNAFIAAKATSSDAVEGTDDVKYITALALRAALDDLDLSGKLDVGAQAVDSALLDGNSLAEIIATITGGAALTLSSLSDAVDAVLMRVASLEVNKLDATAQAVDSALLEGRGIIDLTASKMEGVAGVVTDKFMSPKTTKDALDAHWAEKVGAAPETLDTIEEIVAALRNAPDALDALESVAKEYTDTEVLAAIDLISGVDLVTGTTLASLYTSVQNLETTKLDVDAQAVDSAKLEGYTLSEVMDAAIQPGRLFYPVIHVNGSLDEASYTMPTPADAWAQVQTNAALEQVETVYAIAIKRLLPGNLLNVLSAEGATLIGDVSTAQEGPDYVIMRAGIEDEVWTPVVEYKFACLARLARNCIIVGENTSRFVPGQTLFYNGFDGLSGGVYYDWSMLTDKEWDTFVITDNNIVIDTADFHRSDIRIQATGPVSVTFDLDVDLPFQMDLRFVNQTGVDVTFVGANVFSAPRMEAYTMSKTNGVVVATIQTNAMVNLTGDLEEAFFINPDYVAG